jgi:tetrahydromethanopterin S-methyltransferase subunit H
MQGRVMDSCILIDVNQAFVQVLINAIGVERGREERSVFNSNDEAPIAELIKDWIPA